MKILKNIGVLVFALCLSGMIKAQISLAPSFVFIDENNGVGNVFVNNNSDKSYEVTVNFAFGYPSSNAEGNIMMNYTDSSAYAKYALDPMVRAFPRSFILKGGEQRTVRLQVVPKQRKNEGFYFTRMKVLAKPQSVEVADTVTQGIGTMINFNFEQITAVFYHKGKVSTGINIKNVDINQKDGKLQILPLLQRTGNAPYLGSMYAKLKDAQGKVVAEAQSSTTVYFEEIRRIELNLENVVSGEYNLELSFETRRNDMQASDLTQAQRIVKEQKVVIK
jgi:hypothetical protein